MNMLTFATIASAISMTMPALAAEQTTRTTMAIMGCDTHSALNAYWVAVATHHEREFNDAILDDMKNGNHLTCRHFDGLVRVLITTDNNYCITSDGRDKYQHESVCYWIGKGNLEIDAAAVARGRWLLDHQPQQ